jgi:hypothetical protein
MGEIPPNVDGISVSFLSAGDSDWIKRVIIPLADDIESIAPRHVGEIPAPLRRRMTRSQVVNAGVGPVIAGVTLFVAATIATKTLGDFYDILLKPRIRKIFQGLDKKLSGGNCKSQKVFNSSIWYQEFGVLVSVSVVGKTMNEIESQLDLVDETHSNARNWVAEHGAVAPVLYYKIEAGRVNAKPQLADRLEEVV